MTPNEVIAKVQNLPAVSHAALKLVSLLEQSTVSNDDVVTVLKHDNVLTARLLRACNSPLYGFEEKVSSVEQALLILGHQQILQMVLSLAFGTAMSVTLPGYVIEAKELWIHSLTTAVAAEHLAKAEIPFEVDSSAAFTAGLLHDIGKLALGDVLTADFQTAIRALVNQGGISRSEAEEQVVGTDHSKVGACLLEKWRLPTTIVEAVLNHHHPLFDSEPQLSVMIHVADQLAHHAGSSVGWESFGERVDVRANQALGITPVEFEYLLIGIQESSEKVKNFMNLA
jgi:putative nucleotidyltransferase with HDIG domain